MECQQGKQNYENLGKWAQFENTFRSLLINSTRSADS